MDKRIRIVIADDHPLFREGVRRTLSAFVNYEVVAECASSDEAFDAVSEYLPDIVVLDVSMPGGGIEATRRIAKACPLVRIIMLTASESESDVMKALEVGAGGYVLKGVGGEELANIIKTVHEGGIYVSPGLAARLLIDIKGHNATETFDLFAKLTERENQILEQISLGLSNKEIGSALTLGEKTVQYHVTNILQKLRVRNRVEAAIKAHDHYAAD